MIRRRVLVVDDDPLIRQLITSTLGTRGYECVEAATLNEAASVMDRSGCDLIVCDLMLGEESGLDLVRRIRAGYPNVPIVVVSGLRDRDIASVALDLGAYGYLTKPFDPHQVVIAVDNALRRAALEEENIRYGEQLEALVEERTRLLVETARRLEDVEERLKRLEESRE